MNIATFAQTLLCLAQCNLAADMARIGAFVFGLIVVVLEGWLRLPIRPLFDGYVQALMPRLSSLAVAVFRRTVKDSESSPHPTPTNRYARPQSR